MARNGSRAARIPRLFVEQGLSADAMVAADAGQVNYLKNVLRLKPGQDVLLFNGRDGEWRTAIETIGKKSCEMRCLERNRAQGPAPHLVYMFAPLKHARLDYMVQKATEMGAGVLLPVLTQRTAVSRVNLERMKANAIEAAEQCEMDGVPDIRAPEKLEPAIAAWPDDKTLIYCDESAPPGSPVDQLKALGGEPGGVLIGPEGGFTQGERQLLSSKPFVVGISLGPRIMRADTAAVAALAVVQATLGDWRGLPPVSRPEN